MQSQQATNEVYRITSIIYEILSKFSDNDPIMRRLLQSRLMVFVQYVETETPSFNASGWFKLNNILMYALFSLLASYLILLLQIINWE